MKKKLLSIVAAVAALCSVGTASAQDVLTGDTRLACEAILCLASGTRPSECAPSLRKYFSITARKMSDTIKKRKNFLDLCPVSNQTPEMSALVSAMSRGAGRGSAARPGPCRRSGVRPSRRDVHRSHRPAVRRAVASSS